MLAGCQRKHRSEQPDGAPSLRNANGPKAMSRCNEIKSHPARPSRAAAYIHGAFILVDGGWLAR